MVLPPLSLPGGVRVVGISSAVKHSVGGGLYGSQTTTVNDFTGTNVGSTYLEGFGIVLFDTPPDLIDHTQVDTALRVPGVTGL